MEKLKLTHVQSDKGNARDIYYSKENERYYTRQEFMKGYVQWFTATPYSDGCSSGYEQEYPLKKGLLIVTDCGLVETTMDNGIAAVNDTNPFV